MEIALQGDSRGILYEGYQNSFIQCIFEEGDVDGKNERYEFRCSSNLECCGRVCCVSQARVIPIWLMICLIFLALVLLAAIIGAILYLCKKRPKKVPTTHSIIRSPNHHIYRSIKNDDNDIYTHRSHYDPSYVSPDYLMNGGFGNRGYIAYGDDYNNIDKPSGKNVNTKNAIRASPLINKGMLNGERNMKVRRESGSTYNDNTYMAPPRTNTNTINDHQSYFSKDDQHHTNDNRYPNDNKRKFEETYEENFHEEITMERRDSKELL
uniref:CX domain-containing protein n=1 Tax=Parastrongyloides trichosuri TaxID=131310 RepID=A0A0N4ZZ55_PARTI